MIPHGCGKHKALTVLVPESFDPLAHLPTRLWARSDGAKWFMGAIIRRGMYGHHDGGFVALSSRLMRDTMGRSTWTDTLKALGSYIETRNHINGVRCRGYRIKGLGDNPRRVQIVNPDFAAKLTERLDEWRREHEATLLPIHKALRAIQRKYLAVSPDIDQAIEGLPNRLVQNAIVQTIREQRFGFSVSEGTGRVFNSVCGMKETLRKKHLRLAGEPVAEADIAASQPSLLGQLYTSNGWKGLPMLNVLSLSTPLDPGCRNSAVSRRVATFYGRLPSLLNDVGSDARDFAEMASGGFLYEEMLSAWDAEGLAFPKSCTDRRRWLKKRFLVDVLNYHPADHERPLVQLVRKRWPSVVRFIGEANRLQRGSLIASLQRLESWLMIEQVAPRLVAKDLPVVTLHDSIYSRRQDRKTVCQTFYEVCEKIGFSLKLKEEKPCALAA